MVGKMTFAEVAEKVGISSDKVRHWGKALGIEPAKVRGVCYLEPSAVDILGEMNRAVSSGLSPAAAVAMVRAKPEPATTIAAPAVASPEIADRLEEIEKSVLAVAAENRALRSEVAVLRDRLAAVDPSEGFRRFYASFFERPPAMLETIADRYRFEPLMIEGPAE